MCGEVLVRKMPKIIYYGLPQDLKFPVFEQTMSVGQIFKNYLQVLGQN